MNLTVCSQSESWIVNKTSYSYHNGLPGKEVTCCIQDKMGYLWFGTNNGLARFDGESFKVFTPKTSGLNGRYIKQLLLDDSCGLVIVYSEVSSPNVNIRKYDVLNVHTQEVKPLVDYYKKIPFKEERISFIETDRVAGQLLFYLDWSYQLNPAKFVEDEIWAYNSKTKFSRKKYELDYTLKIFSKNHENYAQMEPYKPTADLKDKAFLFFRGGLFFKTAIPEGPKTVIENRDGSFICRFKAQDTRQADYFKVNPLNFSVAKLSKTENEKLSGGILERDRMVPIAGYTAYWLSDELFIYSEMFGKLRILNAEEGKGNHNRMNTFFVDRSNTIWFCLPTGILKVRIDKNKFEKCFTSSQSKINEEHSARGIVAWNDTLIAGLYTSIAMANKRDTNYVKHPINFSFLKMGESLWLGSFQLKLYDLKTKKISNKHTSECNEIWSIYQVDANHLLLGGTTYIMYYTIDSNTMCKVLRKKISEPTLTYKFFKNSKGQLMAVSNNGLYVLNSSGAEVIDVYSESSEDKNKRFPFTGLNDVLEDEKGNYWLASVSDGIFYWNTKTNTFEQFGTEEGFVSLTTYRMHADTFSNLWVSTEFGLVKFNLATKKAKVYTTAEGLHDNEFNRASSFQKADGTLCFGTQDGIVVFNPADFKDEEAVADYPFLLNKITFMDARTGRDEILKYLPSPGNVLVLTETNKNIKLSFAFLEYLDQHNAYAYRLEGVDSAWTYADRPEIRLNDLSYGTFELRVRAQAGNGSWNKQEIRIPILVKRPFYKTFVFYLLCSLILAGSVFILIRYRFRLLKKQNEKLEVAVESRTLELKTSLAEQIALLQEVHHRVKNNLQFISAMLELQVKSINDDSHKLVLKETSRRVQAMSLVHEMLYRKDKLEAVNLRDYITELVSHLTDATVEEDVLVAVDLSIDGQLKFNINDSVALGMIFSELLSNSIKHAFATTKKPLIKISISYNAPEQELTATYSDNGSGYVMSTQNKQGLGLRLVDIFSRQLQAQTGYNTSKGVVFTFKMHYTYEQF